MAQARSGKGRKGKGSRQPVDRRAKPPTWKGAATRGILFAALLLPISLLFGQPVGGAIVLTVIAAGFYVPLGYWTETLFHRRYMSRLQRERAQAAAEKAQRRKPRQAEKNGGGKAEEGDGGSKAGSETAKAGKG